MRPKVSLLFIGDVLFEYVRENDFNIASSFWDNSLKLFQKADVRIADIDCTLSGSQEGKRGVHLLVEAGINVVSLANDHSFDKGTKGLYKTVALLDEQNIHHAGAGHDIGAAEAPAFVTAKEYNISMIALTDTYVQATSSDPGVWYCPIDIKSEEIKEVCTSIRRLRRNADIVIVSIHWDKETSSNPPTNHIAFARKLIDCGADIVYGHAEHVLRGIEIYKEKPIFYSMGDFILSPEAPSFISFLEWKEQGIARLRVYSNSSQKEIFLQEMKYLCKALQTDVTVDVKKGYVEVFS